MNVEKSVELFVGLTSKNLLHEERGYKELIKDRDIREKYKIPVEKIYIHPLLGTSKVRIYILTFIKQ